MALTADSKKLYIDIPNIEAKRMEDKEGEYYRLTPQGLKAIKDTFHSIAQKVQGNLTLSDLTSLAVDELSANVVVSNTVITQNLYATYGDITELTVDRLLTVNKVENYKNRDTSEINYIHIQDKSFNFVTGTTAGESEQHKDRDGNLLYWKDAEELSMDTEQTAYPVMVYSYTEQIKASISYVMDESTGFYMPKITLGVGNGNGDNAKGFIYKGTTGLCFDYYSNNGELRRIMLGDEGITISPYDLESIDMFNNGFSAEYNDTPVAMTWTLDANGRITSLITNDNVTIPVTWHTEDM